MPNNKPIKNNNNNFKSSVRNTFRWVASIGGALLTALLIWMVSTLVTVDKRTESMQTDVEKHTTWIYNWEYVLKVQKLDAEQSAAIAVLQPYVKELRTDVDDLKIEYAYLGGPKDPLWNKVENLSIRIASLEEFIRR